MLSLEKRVIEPPATQQDKDAWLCIAKVGEDKSLLSWCLPGTGSSIEHLHSHKLDESARLKQKFSSSISRNNLLSAQLVFIIQA